MTKNEKPIKNKGDEGNGKDKGHYVEIAKEFHFEAAHHLPNVPPEHKCRRLHGHSYRFEVCLGGYSKEESGWLRDFQDIRNAVQGLIEKHLDHYYLNEVSGLENPTSENLAVWLWERLEKKLPELKEITVFETCTSRCTYRGKKI